jgi:flavin-binding protein dodecin
MDGSVAEHMTADPFLGLTRGRPHTILIAYVQLTNVGAAWLNLSGSQSRTLPRTDPASSLLFGLNPRTAVVTDTQGGVVSGIAAPLTKAEEEIMSESVYKVIELVGTSPTSWEDAARNAVETAGQSLKNLRIAEIGKLDMRVEDGKVTAYRARVNLSFKYTAD